MSLRNFVHSYKEIKEPQTFQLPLINPRDSNSISFTLETFDGSDYSFDIGGGDVKTRPSIPQPISETLDASTGTNTTFYLKRSNVKTLRLLSKSYDFNSEILYGFSNLKALQLRDEVDLDILRIPQSVNDFVFVADGAVVNGYNTRRNFTYTTMRRFILNNTGGTGLTSGEVDDLLEDLSLADWEGVKTVTIAGVHSARTSASDSFVTTLQGKGVTVTTN